MPQFKSGANEQTGVVEPLGGKYERVGTAPIIVWERADGRQEVISGRHRLDLARRSGETSIPAQVLREADGFDARQASILDAELNIRDGQGKVKDYVKYFQHAGLTQEEANLRGLVSRSVGQRAFAIANEGSPGLIASHRADQLTDDAAWRIAKTAPRDERLQSVGIKAIQDGKSIAAATNLMQAVKSMGVSDTTGDMFGFDDSAMKQAEAMGKAAERYQRRLSEQLAAVQGAAKRPEQARALGLMWPTRQRCAPRSPTSRPSAMRGRTGAPTPISWRGFARKWLQRPPLPPKRRSCPITRKPNSRPNKSAWPASRRKKKQRIKPPTKRQKPTEPATISC